MMVPIGVVKAGNPAAAAHDALDVGRLKDQPVGEGPGQSVFEKGRRVA